MKKAVLTMSKFFVLKQEKPNTKMEKIYWRCKQAVTALAVVYLLLQVFPQVLFTHNVESHGIQVYCTDPIITEESDYVLSVIQSKVAESTLYQDEERFVVFICNSKWLYTFFVPFCRGSFGISNPVTQKIFLANVELSFNRSRRFGRNHNVRSFTSVVSHEIGHQLIRRRFGFWATQKIPTWLKEGYCELLAGDPAILKKMVILF